MNCQLWFYQVVLNWSIVVPTHYALLLRTTTKHCSWNEILFIRDINSFNGDGNFAFILFFSSSPASRCLSSFFFFFFSPFLESRLVSFYFESHLEGGPLLFLSLFLWWPFYMQGSAVKKSKMYLGASLGQMELDYFWKGKFEGRSETFILWIARVTVTQVMLIAECHLCLIKAELRKQSGNASSIFYRVICYEKEKKKKRTAYLSKLSPVGITRPL